LNSGVLNISIPNCGQFSDKITVCLRSTALDKLKILRIRYIALDDAFTKFDIYTIRITNTPGQVLNSANPYQSNFGVPAINMS